MFHDGTLQSGISLAIQEQKLVACFVRDDGEESSTWEKEWLQSGWLASLLEQKAVLLRLEAGSTEAGFLSAFCPLSQIPSFVVIQNGQLREHLVAGISKDDFINRIRKVLGANEIPQASGASSTSTPQAPSTPEATQASSALAPPASEQHHPVSPVLPPSSKAKGKQKVEPKPDASTVKPAQLSAREALRKKQREEKEELERIKARIEADKAARRAEAELRRQEREREKQEAQSGSASLPSYSQASTSKRGSQAKDVRLNVRLFDGRTVHHVFPRTAKLQDDVRPWIDEEFATRAESPSQNHPPYYFKQILAPLPSRELSAGEESETLGEIDLAPSATLVLIPVKGYTEAYSGGGGGVVGGVVGGVTGLVGGVLGIASSAVGYVGTTLGSVVGYGSAPGQQSTPQADGRTLNQQGDQDSNAGAAGIRVRTLADQRAREPQNQAFYNGNQLNFEPNEDDSNRRS
ncbi:hypothetical protein BDV96DRAFT_529045 [Lophiotrema nucula]|uniref:UBX domain-containing protein 2 n=1 Tax=Lophiotrema nucula TaxID=690887 RepID=A0A6A5YR70_9PLEO|nr:hypothetical protein BDV96DRAFT_529045 [Lophiotrema nucula]